MFNSNKKSGKKRHKKFIKVLETQFKKLKLPLNEFKEVKKQIELIKNLEIKDPKKVIKLLEEKSNIKDIGKLIREAKTLKRQIINFKKIQKQMQISDAEEIVKELNGLVKLNDMDEILKKLEEVKK